MIKEKLEHSQIKCTFDVTPEEFEKALDASFELNNKKVTIKGFRKGSAPRSVFEKNFGVEALYEDALQDVLNAKYAELIKNDPETAKDILSIVTWAVEGDEKIERNTPFKVSITFDVYPEVKLGAYKGVETLAAKTTVSDEEVNAAVDSLRKSKATKAQKEEQVIASGDFATFDFKGYVGDEAFEGGEAKNYNLQIGSGQFIPGFEDQMIGMKAGETKDVIVTFPENYGATHLAGKEAKFVVTVHSVEVEVLPELTDEFVAELKIENVNNKEELFNHKKEELLKKLAVSEKDRQTNDIITKIVDATEADLPLTIVNQVVENMRNQYKEQAKMYNIPFETFLGLMNTTLEDFNKTTEEQGKRQAKFEVIYSEIVRAENLAPTQEAVEEKAKSVAEKTKEKVEDVLKSQGAYFRSQLAYDNFIKFILDNAKFIEA